MTNHPGQHLGTRKTKKRLKTPVTSLGMGGNKDDPSLGNGL